MARKIAYWITTVLAAGFALLGITYLFNPKMVEAFTHVGYPQQLRVMLGIAKPLAAITLLVPGLPTLKEWAYAGLTFAWISACVAHCLAKDSPEKFIPLVLLVLLAVSYVTRPASRRCNAKTATAQ